MTFEEAIIKAVRKYYEGEDPLELMAAQGKEIKYTREYFDELEEELREDDDELEDDFLTSISLDSETVELPSVSRHIIFQS